MGLESIQESAESKSTKVEKKANIDKYRNDPEVAGAEEEMLKKYKQDKGIISEIKSKAESSDEFGVPKSEKVLGKEEKAPSENKPELNKSETMPEEIKNFLAEINLKKAEYEKLEEAIKDFLKRNWGVENVPGDLSKWPRSEELKPLLDARDAAKAELEKKAPLYFKEAKLEKEEVADANYLRLKDASDKSQNKLDEFLDKDWRIEETEKHQEKLKPLIEARDEAKKKMEEYLPEKAKSFEDSMVAFKDNEIFKKLLPGEQKIQLEKFATAYKIDEAVKLYDAETALLMQRRADSMPVIVNKLKEWGDAYRKLDWKKKVGASLLLLAGIGGSAAIGGGVGAGMAVIFGAGTLAQKVLSGFSTTMALEGLMARGHKKIINKDVEETARKKIESLIAERSGDLSADSLVDFMKTQDSILDKQTTEKIRETDSKFELRRWVLAGTLGTLISSGFAADAIRNVYGGSFGLHSEVVAKPSAESTSLASGEGVAETVPGVTDNATATGAGVTETLQAHDVSSGAQPDLLFTEVVKPGDNVYKLVNKLAHDAAQKAGLGGEDYIKGLAKQILDNPESQMEINGQMVPLKDIWLIHPGDQISIRGVLDEKGVLSWIGSATDNPLDKLPMATEAGWENIKIAAEHVQIEKHLGSLPDKGEYLKDMFREFVANPDANHISNDAFKHIVKDFDSASFDQQKAILGYINERTGDFSGERVAEFSRLTKEMLNNNSFLNHLREAIEKRTGEKIGFALNRAKDVKIGDLDAFIAKLSRRNLLGSFIGTDPNLTGYEALLKIVKSKGADVRFGKMTVGSYFLGLAKNL